MLQFFLDSPIKWLRNIVQSWVRRLLKNEPGDVTNRLSTDRKMSQSAKIAKKSRFFWLTAGLAGLVVAAGVWAVWPISSDVMEIRALDAVKKGNLSEAESWLKRLQRRRPRDLEVLNTLAELADRQGRPRDGIDWLTLAAEASPEPAPRFVETGARAFESHLADRATQLYTKALIADPHLLGGYSALARLALITHQPVQLRQTISAADQQSVEVIDDPILLWLWIVGDRGQWGSTDAEAWLSAAIKNEPNNTVLLAALARVLMQSSRIEAAQEIWASPLTEARTGWPLRLVRAEWEIQTDQLSAAASTLATLPTEADGDPRTWHARARLAAVDSDAELALALAGEALRLEPMLTAAAHLRGKLLDRLHRGEEAREQLAKAVQMDQLHQRTLQLLQQSTPDGQDALAAAELAAELGLDRWAELVSRWVTRRSPRFKISERLEMLRTQPARPSPLTVPSVNAVDQAALRQRFDVRPRKSPTLPSTITPQATAQLRFREVTDAIQLNFTYEFGHAPEHWLMETLGGGVAAMDYDHDGRLDLFFAQAGPLSLTKATASFSPCTLFRNNFAERFHDVTLPSSAGVAGYYHGCVAGDFNEDGFVDLILCGYGQTTFLRNQGDGTWIDDTLAAGLTNDRWTTSGTAVDLDRDGDLDLYQAAYCDAPLSPSLRTCRDGGKFSACRPNAYPPARDILWENCGDGRFVDRTLAAGMTEDGGYGLGTVAADFDSDGWPDVFVGNDTTANFLWWNEAQSLKLSEGGLAAGVGVDGQGRAEACMGIACGDVDGNGFLDLFVTNFHDETATLYLNNGSRSFEDRTEAAGLSNTGRQLMGWGTQFVDLNADGWLDVVILNGHLHDMPQSPQVYFNQAGRFTEVSATAGDFFQKPALGRSLAVGDFDSDGRDDLAVSHQTGPAAVLRNESPAGNNVRLQLVGSTSVRDATGTMIRATIGERKIVQQVTRQGGYLSSCSPEVGLGLGQATHIDQLEITWPSGQVDHYEHVPAGTHWLLRELQPPLKKTRDPE